MSILNKHIVLVLNSLWLPIGYITVKKALTAMLSTADQTIPAARAIDLSFEKNLEGKIDYSKLSDSPRDVCWDEWITLPIRDYDEVIHTSKISVRVPTIIITNFSKMPMRRLKVNKERILQRDKYTCCYTGKKLSKSQLSIDHVIPRSRGGKETWTNLVACDKKLNFKKRNLTPQEAGLRLLKKPVAPPEIPAISLIGEIRHPTWIPFLQK